jgi:hypothetical protein
MSHSPAAQLSHGTGSGRRATPVLAAFGADALSYAQDIFRLGSELDDVARGRKGAGRNVRRVGLVGERDPVDAIVRTTAM